MTIERHPSPALFFTGKEKKILSDAIEAAEKNTSAEIRVHLITHAKNSVLDEAKACFEKLGMTKTKEKNGVLILLATKSHEFAIVGDSGIHEKLPSGYWELLVKEAESCMSADHFLEGLTRMIVGIGEKLTQYFPAGQNNHNELSNDVSH